MMEPCTSGVVGASRPLIVAAAAAPPSSGAMPRGPRRRRRRTEPGLGPPVEQPGQQRAGRDRRAGRRRRRCLRATPVAGTTAPGSRGDRADRVASRTDGTATRPRLPALATTTTLARPTEAEWAAVDTYLQDRLLDGGDFAFGIAVSIDGVPVHAASFGDAQRPGRRFRTAEDVDSPTDSDVSTTSSTTTTTLPPPPPEPVDATDRFRIASLSKVITGTVTLQLVEAGQLSLDEPVGARLGAALGVDVAGRPAESITVRQLLAHTTGFNVFRNTFFGRGVENCREAGARGLSEGAAVRRRGRPTSTRT